MKRALFAFLFLASVAMAEISWMPDDGGNRVILIVKGGMFTPDLYLPLTWKFAQDYEEMAWCTFQDGKWQKVYPFGDGMNEVVYKPQWLRKSRF